MRLTLYIFALALFISCYFLSCEEIETSSEIPEIEFTSFELSEYLYKDTTALGFEYIRGILTLEFKDGDGDFGIYYGTPDTIYNLFLTLLEKVDGEFHEVVQTDTLMPALNRRIMYEDAMAREGQNKLLKGKLELLFRYFKNFTPYDTIRYDLYIKDRSGNESNVESTDEIVFDWSKY